MTTIRADLIDEVIDYSTIYHTVNVRPTYSGRGMYGAECFGIVFEGDADMYVFMVALAEVVKAGHHAIDAMEMAHATRTDSMGLDMIAYWPGYTLDGESSYADIDDDDDVDGEVMV